MNPKDLPDVHAGAACDRLARARELKAVLAEAAPRIEADKAVPPAVLEALFDARMFRLLLPRSLDGDEIDLPAFFDVTYELAQGDASATWSVAQSNGCAMAAAYMEPAAARAMFAPRHAVLSWGYPQGPCRATPVDGGWRVSGTWGFGSGSRHSTWVGGHCQVTDAAGEPLKNADGSAQERTALIPRADITIVDDRWEVIGLRGTGSDSYAVKDYFVPQRHCVVPRGVGRDLQLPDGAEVPLEDERREPGPLFRFSPSIVYQAGFCAVALGLARAMLDDFIALAQQKSPSGFGTLLRDSAAIQTRVAISEARLTSMHGWVRASLKDSWEHCVAEGAHRFDDRMTMRLCSTWAIREASKVARDVWADAGATAIFAAHPFERRFRDMQAVTQQIQSNPMHLATVGQHLLGMPASTRFI